MVDILREQKKRVLESALAWGRGYRKEPMFLFPRPDGEPHDPMGMTVRLRQVMRRAKVSGSALVHGWRHTCATLLINDHNIKTISHSTAAITLELYVHPTEKNDRAAGEHLGRLIRPRGNSK